MEDSSLDDFFAKKDKSKKAKKKFTTTEQIAKKLEESGKKTTETMMASKPEKEKTPVQIGTQPVSTITQVASPDEDDEWRDFEEEKEKDYSGLKIQNLQINEIKEEDFEREKNFEDDDGEPVKIRDGSSGPWKHISGNAPAMEEPPSPPPVVEVEPKEEAPKSGVYRPPHARSTTGSTQQSSRSRHSNKTAPELTSELHFPSLSAAADNIKGSKKGGFDDKGFESVKRGSKTSEDVGNKGPKLDLGNKYNALSPSDMS